MRTHSQIVTPSVDPLAPNPGAPNPGAPNPWAPNPLVSPMVISDRLLSLAQIADKAGLTATAEQLVHLACAVFDEAPKRAH